jgi:hypothetical protein
MKIAMKFAFVVMAAITVFCMPNSVKAAGCDQACGVCMNACGAAMTQCSQQCWEGNPVCEQACAAQMTACQSVCFSK